MLEHLTAAERVAIGLGDQRRHARALAALAECSRLTGAHDRAVETGERARALAVVLADPIAETEANFHLALTYRSLARFRRAVELLRRNALQHGTPVSDSSAIAGRPGTTLGWLGWCLAQLGEFEDAVPIALEAIRVAGFGLAGAFIGIGGVHLFRGDFDAAIPALQRGLDFCRATDVPFFLPWLATELGHAYTLTGRLSDAIPLLEEGVARGDSLAMMQDHSLRVGWLAHGYLAAGRVEHALEAAERSLSLARRYGERGNEAYAHHLLGAIATHEHLDVDSADAHYSQAMARAEELEMRPLVAHCHLGLGTLYGHAGQPTRAQEHLTTAVALFEAMGMRTWRERAAAERAR